MSTDSAASFPVTLQDPASGQVLVFEALGPAEDEAEDGIWQAEAGATRWPQIDGVVFVRAGREALAEQAAADLCAGRRDEALARLLTDVDDFAPQAPSWAAALAVARDLPAGRLSPRAAMQRLAYGPVADYFGLRASTPTFASGLGLIAEHADPAQPLVEIACGVGHFLYHAGAHGLACVGVDVTFSKVWLARHTLVAPDVALICADVVAGEALALAPTAGANVFCHDAFYFFDQKPRAARRLQALAGETGRVLLGHVHLAGQDHGGIAGALLAAPGYEALFSDVTHRYDDAALARDVAAGRSPRPSALSGLDDVDAMALVAGRAAPDGVARHLLGLPADMLVYPNPLLAPDATGRLAPAWPSDAFAREYADTAYLHGAAPAAVDALPRQTNTSAPALWQQRLALPGAYIRLAVAPVRWVVVGCGWVAREHVIPGLADAPSAQLVGLCDLDADKRAACQAAAGRPVAESADLADLLAVTDADAVYIATPNDSHAALARVAAAAGCHVYCEKPLATHPADARAMQAACAGAGVRLATAFDQRFHEAHHVLRAAVAGGALGTITQARVHYACLVDDAWQASAGDSDNWRLDRARAGGGAAIDLAPHAIDLLAFVLGAAPVDVQAYLQPRLGTPSGAGAVDAGGLLAVTFDTGCLASVHVSYQCPEYLPRRTLELVGTAGGAQADNTMGQTPGGQITWRSAQGAQVQTFGQARALSPFARQLEAFSAQLLAGRDWPFPIERDIHHFELLHAALERAESRY